MFCFVSYSIEMIIFSPCSEQKEEQNYTNTPSKLLEKVIIIIMIKKNPIKFIIDIEDSDDFR